MLAESSFGPGREPVEISIKVLRFRDNVAPDPKIRPTQANSRWSSALVEVCRPRPIVFGYIAWILRDEEERTAQLSKVLHKEFPQPPFPNESAETGCARGWLTWATQKELTPSRVAFEQTRQTSPHWRVS